MRGLHPPVSIPWPHVQPLLDHTAREYRVGAREGSAESVKAGGGGKKDPENMPWRWQVSPHTQRRHPPGIERVI